MQETVIYGIPNCDTIKKTLDWFKKHRIPHRLHDYKKEGIRTEQLRSWAARTDWKLLLNTRGTTWRKLPPETQQSVKTAAAAIRLMTEHSSLIKRPVIESGDLLLVGFDEEQLKKAFHKTK